jgi:hypothetical protein
MYRFSEVTSSKSLVFNAGLCHRGCHPSLAAVRILRILFSQDSMSQDFSLEKAEMLAVQQCVVGG